ncbi:MAG: 3'-5' exonuclease [Liquorilactobacillus ghanensis]|uniref:3'-5' exonuclease n=1 Tax=Liquorilactobacillus ghanensis TaxID=399370 RepID=UPI0039EA8023
MNFSAIDFETANGHRNSACSLAITVVKDNQIVDQLYSLLNPQTYFDRRNIKIHGIQEADVQEAPTIADLWPHIAALFQPDKLIVAHNARFDCSVLQNSLATFGISTASFAVLDTLQSSRRLLKGYENYRLNTVCQNLNIELQHHHNALADSIACAQIALWQQNHFGSDALLPFIKQPE